MFNRTGEREPAAPDELPNVRREQAQTQGLERLEVDAPSAVAMSALAAHGCVVGVGLGVKLPCDLATAEAQRACEGCAHQLVRILGPKTRDIRQTTHMPRMLACPAPDNREVTETPRLGGPDCQDYAEARASAIRACRSAVVRTGRTSVEP